LSIRTVDSYLVADLDDSQFILDTKFGVPVIVHHGQPIPDDDITNIPSLGSRGIARATLDVEAPALLCPEHGSGWQGRPGIKGHRPDGSGWAPRCTPRNISVSDTTACVLATDDVAQIQITTEIEAMPNSVRIRLLVRNLGESDYHLDEATLTVPVPQRAAEVMHLTGYWSHEFQIERLAWPKGALSFENRRGRTSHDRVPAVFVGQTGFGENHGDVWGFTLGWSGNAINHLERMTDGRRVVQLGELLAPGDVVLSHNQSYETPWLEVAASSSGLNRISQAFHSSIRSHRVTPTIDKPRPVLLNTWEAVYFNHDLPTLIELANRAAEVGSERFVLDDGWFYGRRDDKAGLGDWWVDPVVWPNGLTPLIEHVTGLGMEFGIWVEPEMVNLDSDLFRAHPEWVLAAQGYEPVQGRDQLALNLGNPDAFDYLLEKLDRLLADHDVSYVKWDVNRDLIHASDGVRASTHDHMLGVYALIDQLRDRHPGVEIESCASGGGRADFEILKRTERIWTSDSNDAFERQRIQRGFSVLMPPEVMGAHIGPPTSQTSGRTHTLTFRASTAFFGHLGIEWNLMTAGDHDRKLISQIVAEHKKHRELLHGGTVWRLDVADPSVIAHMVVARDKSEALVSYAQMDLPAGTSPLPLRLVGLDPDRLYTLARVNLGGLRSSANKQTDWFDEGLSASGRLLQTLGFQAPNLNPESAVVVHLTS
jgi:alpha-galactosidase